MAYGFEIGRILRRPLDSYLTQVLGVVIMADLNPITAPWKYALPPTVPHIHVSAAMSDGQPVLTESNCWVNPDYYPQWPATAPSVNSWPFGFEFLYAEKKALIDLQIEEARVRLAIAQKQLEALNP